MIMNLLNGGCLARYCRIPFWSNPCCKDRLTSASLNNLDDNRPKQVSRSHSAKLFDQKQCSSKLLILPIMTSWTQIRFNKDCPQLHRDIEFPNFDPYRKDEYKDVRKTDWGAGDGKPGITYAIGFFGWLCGSYGIKAQVTHYATYMAAAADVLALASIEVDLAKIAPGACSAFKWRGKPLFVKHRTPVDIEAESNTPMSALRDPETPEQRAQNPEWLIVIGICTHLGCVPLPNSGDWPGGFYCPCHGSHYDNIGRARKGPAPLNLEVPPYKFVGDSLVIVG